MAPRPRSTGGRRDEMPVPPGCMAADSVESMTFRIPVAAETGGRLLMPLASSSRLTTQMETKSIDVAHGCQVAAHCAPIRGLRWCVALSGTFAREHCLLLGSMELGRSQLKKRA